MKIQLIQLDGKIPNIALMRIAAHHKSLGDEVELRRAFTVSALERRLFDRPDLVYASLLFKKTRPLAERLKQIYRGAIVGGTGWDEQLALEDIGITTTSQDYSIYPKWRQSIGYSQRGCRFKCPFVACLAKKVPLKKCRAFGISGEANLIRVN